MQNMQYVLFIYDFLPQVRDLVRDQVEKDLTFAGFVIISCPLKSDSKAAIKEILHSSHGVSLLLRLYFIQGGFLFYCY